MISNYVHIMNYNYNLQISLAHMLWREYRYLMIERGTTLASKFAFTTEQFVDVKVLQYAKLFDTHTYIYIMFFLLAHYVIISLPKVARWVAYLDSELWLFECIDDLE
jgi:hypothetical protein